MNKVKERCGRDSCAKFLYASKRMFFELKLIKFGLYFLSVIPVVFCFIQTEENYKILCSMISFALTLFNEFISNFLSDYKEKAILSHQLYEASITGSTFSKIEYDREATNDINEHAIRRGLPRMKKATTYPISNVPSEITDDYSYLYLCRKSAATTRYLLGRVFILHATLLAVVIATYAILISMNIIEGTGAQALYYLICFWPLIVPFIRNCSASRKCQRQCVKICADIDNFFADGDASVERLARFYYYVQNIEFEMMLTRPIIYTFIQKLCARGVRILSDGVTARFKEAIGELKSKSLLAKGVITAPKTKSIITDDTNYSLDAVEEALALEKEKEKKRKARAKALEQKKEEEKVEPKEEKATEEKPKTRAKSATSTKKTTTEKKTTEKKTTAKSSTKKSTTKKD